MFHYLTRSRVLTLLALIVGVSGVIGPEVTTLNPFWGKIIGLTGLAAAACGRTLVRPPASE